MHHPPFFFLLGPRGVNSSSSNRRVQTAEIWVVYRAKESVRAGAPCKQLREGRKKRTKREEEWSAFLKKWEGTFSLYPLPPPLASHTSSPENLVGPLDVMP